MNLNPGKTALALLGPLLLLAFGLLLASGAPPSAPFGGFKAPSGLAPLAPYLAAAPGALLAWWFGHGRAMFMLALLALAHATIGAFVAGAPGADVNGQVIYAALSLLVPVNIAVFALIPERAAFSVHGLTRAVSILIQIAVVSAVAGAGPAAHKIAADLLHFRLFDPAFDAWTYITQPGLLAYGLAALALLARLLATRSHIDGGALGALAASALALHMVGKGPAPAVFFTVAAMLLTLAVIQDAYRMAFIDELTGLPGRRALTAAMKNLGGSYSIAMVDVDFFKKFNDAHGHDAGDQVLQMVAAKLAAAPGGGRAFRYGGEEFSVLFAGKTMDQAWEPLETLRKNIAAGRFALRDKDRPKDKPANPNRPRRIEKAGVTISIGVAEKGACAAAPEEILRAADKALYRAKNNGRNRVCQ